MKILRIFGVVVGIHALAFLMILLNPGCSSAKKPTSPPDSAAAVEPAANEVPTTIASAEPDAAVSIAAADTSAAPTPESGGNVGVRFAPTRPGTPVARALETQPVTDVTPASTYTVAPGDSLWVIARRNKLTVAELAAANNISRDATVRIGQKLIIPAKTVPSSSMSVTDPVATTAPANPPAATKSRGQSVKHVVMPGETLGAIARKYQVKVGDIATANNIADPRKLRAGMELTIPGWQAPAGRTPTQTPASTPTTTAPATPSPDEVPTVIIPPESNPTAEEPPVIQVD
jgi:FOG: LysM repeat